MRQRLSRLSILNGLFFYKIYREVRCEVKHWNNDFGNDMVELTKHYAGYDICNSLYTLEEAGVAIMWDCDRSGNAVSFKYECVVEREAKLEGLWESSVMYLDSATKLVVDNPTVLEVVFVEDYLKKDNNIVVI